MLYVIFRVYSAYHLHTCIPFRGKRDREHSGERSCSIGSNHISNFDPPTVGVKIRRKVHFMAKEELFKVPIFGSLIRSLARFRSNAGA